MRALKFDKEIVEKDGASVGVFTISGDLSAASVPKLKALVKRTLGKTDGLELVMNNAEEGLDFGFLQFLASVRKSATEAKKTLRCVVQTSTPLQPLMETAGLGAYIDQFEPLPA